MVPKQPGKQPFRFTGDYFRTGVFNSLERIVLYRAPVRERWLRMSSTVRRFT